MCASSEAHGPYGLPFVCRQRGTASRHPSPVGPLVSAVCLGRGTRIQSVSLGPLAIPSPPRFSTWRADACASMPLYVCLSAGSRVPPWLLFSSRRGIGSEADSALYRTRRSRGQRTPLTRFEPDRLGSPRGHHAERASWTKTSQP